MATITGFTAERMLEIEGASIIEGEIIGGDLILTKHDGTTINAGPVIGPPGPQGPVGPASVGAIPGEVKLWPGDVLPAEATYGKWVWADGQDYAISDHPKAAAHISTLWKTMYGLTTDPGATRFRVPDLRGVTPAGLDQMPAGSARGRANRLTRSVAIQLARLTGKETHILQPAEMARHDHGGSVSVGVNVSGGISGSTDTHGGHSHGLAGGATYVVGALGRTALGSAGSTHYVGQGGNLYTGDGGAHAHAVGGSFSGSGSGSGSIAPSGNDAGHETVQPTVMVPYIVYLDVV